VLLISSVPLAILTNSTRIALTAVLHKYFGHEIAQGFFHGFSGLVIFLISIPVLLLVIKVLTKLPPHKNKLLSSSTSTRPQPSDNKVLEDEKSTSKSAVLRQPIYIVTMVLLVSTFALSQNVEFRQRVPAKKSFDQFPLQFAKWSAEGRQSMSKWAIDELDLNDYMIADYQSQKNDRVNTYVVYYERQTKGKSIHSPASCLPGSGWSFDQSGTVRISGLSGNPGSMEVNRAVLQYGSSTQIAYYWFAQRGRILNNAYQLKIYNFWDALTMQRTDGALIRLITPVYEAESLAAADIRLQNFVRDFVPVLEEYIPGREISS
jgi:exosortase D (VPLPA-CTERM-specific)